MNTIKQEVNKGKSDAKATQSYNLKGSNQGTLELYCSVRQDVAVASSIQISDCKVLTENRRSIQMRSVVN